MKKMEYEGSFVNDLNNINSTEEYSFLDFILDSDNWEKIFFPLGALIVFAIFLTADITKPLVAFAIIPAKELFDLYKETKKKDKTKREKSKRKIKEFAANLSDEKDLYKSIRHSVIITKQEEEQIEDPLAEYVEYITSEIYYIDNNERIAALREVKKRISYKEGEELESSTLFSLDYSELPSREVIPVKQMLQLKKD